MLGLNSLLDIATITNLLVNLAQVSRGSLRILTAVLSVGHWISHTVPEIQPAQKHAQPDPACWMHCKNSDQTEIRDMLYSSREMKGNRELWWKASITVTSPGKGGRKLEKENHLWFLGLKILFPRSVCMKPHTKGSHETGDYV